MTSFRQRGQFLCFTSQSLTQSRWYSWLQPRTYNLSPSLYSSIQITQLSSISFDSANLYFLTLSFFNSVLDQNHFTQDYEYYPYPANNIPCTTPLQAYLTTDQQYTIPMYPRPGTPTPFNPCPPQILTRGAPAS